ncbi:MAG TPA: DNA polymerase I, partial [Spirochaetota bacterium]
EVKGKLAENLRACREMAYMSRDLVTIRTNIDLNVTLDELIFKGFDTERASKRFLDLEMKSIAKDFVATANAAIVESKTDEVKSIENSPHDYSVIRDQQMLAAAITEIRRVGKVSVDTETTSVKPVDADLVGISLSIRPHQGWYLSVMNSSLFTDNLSLSKKEILSALKPVLEDPSIAKFGQNIKYDMIVFRNEGIAIAGINGDAMIASYLLDPSERKHNLDDMALEHLNYKTITYEELTGKGKNATPISEIPVEKVSDYACEDADIAFQLAELIGKKCDNDGVGKLYRDLELPLIEVLAAMEFSGVKIDRKYFSDLAGELDAKIDKSLAAIKESAGEDFNVNSTKELSRILFEKLALPTVKKTKTGFSTDISVLEELAGSHPIVSHLIEYRTLAKLKGTYVDALPELISERTGRIHTSFNQTIAATGRLSSSDPNLQNIPIRDEFGKRIRKGFVPDKGNLILSADYSQIELRIAAHVSKDENMMRAFREKIDIHTLTASSVFNVPIDQVEDWMRRQGKTINFATIYGVSPYGLSRQTDISIKEAAQFIDRYFESYPKFREYIDRTIMFAREHGYVETIFGRRRPVPEINSTAVFRREGAERIAINTPIQGSSADIIKVAMINIYREFIQRKLAARIILQVHDELVVEAAESEREEVESIVRDNMENAFPLDVPMVVDIAWGPSWGEAH